MNSKKQETNQQKDPNLLYTLQCILHIRVKVQICKHILSNNVLWILDLFSTCKVWCIVFKVAEVLKVLVTHKVLQNVLM